MKKIVINSPKHGVKEVLVDDEDYDDLSEHKWHISKGRICFYAFTNIKLGGCKYWHVGMHRVIMKLGIMDSKIEVDHRDFNGLNNQKNNLRKCTRRQNSMNMRGHGTSKYLGVCKLTKKNPNADYTYWMASIKIDGRQKTIGVFEFTKEGEVLAAKSYDEYAIKHFGEFANPNFK